MSINEMAEIIRQHYIAKENPPQGYPYDQWCLKAAAEITMRLDDEWRQSK